MTTERFNLLKLNGKMRTLHLSWVAFLITFMVWFNHAPLLLAIADTLHLTKEQIKTLLILNVALTIPARILVGMLTDRFGPRAVYSALLILGSIPCFTFAFADSYTVLAVSRFLLGFIGAGFVIGIRLMGEWFPAKELGTAEGVYGGWGNFGSAAAAFLLPTVAAVWGGPEGWRYACALTGVISFIYGFIFYSSVQNTPKHSTYFKPKKSRAMEVTSTRDFCLLILTKIPMYLTLALLAWKLSPAGVHLLSQSVVYGIYIGLAALFIVHSYSAYQVNRDVFIQPVAEIHRYAFKQVTILSIFYFITFGSELAVVSMLPLFFQETFHLSTVVAGFLGASFAFTNLIARPGGGILSDALGRKKILMIVAAGLVIGFAVLSCIDDHWPVWLAMIATVICSLFVQGGNGAVFAVVPLIKRRLTGQIAGMTGAYGNVGGVVYLTVFSLVSYQAFFLFIAATALLGLLAVFFLNEPKGVIVEIMPDGSLAEIAVG